MNGNVEISHFDHRFFLMGYGNMKMVDLAPQPTTIGLEWDIGYVWDERKNLETPPNGGFQNGGTPRSSKIRPF